MSGLSKFGYKTDMWGRRQLGVDPGQIQDSGDLASQIIVRHN